MKERLYTQKIAEAIPVYRIITLVGSHGAGKTAVFDNFRLQLPDNKTFYISSKKQLNRFLSHSRTELRRISKMYDYLAIDVNTKILEPELNTIVNSFSKKIIITLSYDYNSTKINHGQDIKKIYIHPYTLKELYPKFDDAKEHINEHLIYGFYPAVLEQKSKKDKIFTLSDILELNLKDEVPQFLELDYKKLLELLKFLALNIGKNISYQAFAKNTGLEKNQVKQYLEFLERRMIIFTMRSFSRSLPKEMSKAQKFYFWDTGVRNLLVNSFDDINIRRDFEQIWENFCISERLKRNALLLYNAKSFFWKTYDQKEIPYIEENYGFLFAYAFSWKHEPNNYPRQFINAYSNAVYSIINLEKLWDFLS